MTCLSRDSLVLCLAGYLAFILYRIIACVRYARSKENRCEFRTCHRRDPC